VADGAVLATAQNIAPDGTQTANTIAYGTANNRIYQYDNSGVLGSKTFSFYAKAYTGSTLVLFNSNPTTNITLNLSTGTASGTGSATTTLTSVGNGWWRIAYTGTWAVASGNSSYFTLSCSVAGTSVYVWGWQYEALAFPTSYIATTSAQVTRASDNASITGTNFSSWYNNGAQGTFYADVNLINPNNTFVVGFTGTNYTSPLRTTAGPAWEMYDGVSDKIFNPSSYVLANTNYKIATSWATGTNSTLYQNGTLIGSITPVAYFTGFNGISILANGLLTNFATGRIKKLTYYSLAVTSTNQQALTGS
jgi:hypothetical protein